MNEFLNYVNYKLITAFINDDDVFEKISEFDAVILTKNFLLCLEGYREVYLETNKLDKDQVYNLKRLVNYVRENIKVQDSTIKEIINNLICSLNQTNGSNKTEYLVDNFIARFSGHNKIKIFLDIRNTQYYIDKIKYSASRDYDYLLLLTYFSDEEFEKYKEKAVLDEYFLLSLNQIISEHNEIVDNALFTYRTKIILNENIERLHELEDKSLKKIIKKEYKYYNKHL